MSGNQPVNCCHKARTADLNGRKIEDDAAYGIWAYWCGATQDGWKSMPCVHLLFYQQKPGKRADRTSRLGMTTIYPHHRKRMLENGGEEEATERTAALPPAARYVVEEMPEGRKQLDITAPRYVEILHNDDTLWVNVDGICALRCCRIAEPIAIETQGRRKHRA